ncbi:MAG: hypothetical protein NXI10_05350 [bacterium]|nr:hypothetical protein [bacterium]
MAFNGSEGDFITLAEGAAMTKAWRDANSSDAIKGVFFGKEKLQQLLDQAGSEGIRIYFGLNEEGKNSLVLVSADADQNDNVNGLILDRGAYCPDICSAANALNS